MDERLKWIESKISSSMRARNEDMKAMLSSDENRLAFHEFIKNEDCRHLYIFTPSHRKIVASLSPPHNPNSKFMYFMKSQGTKLTKDNIGEEVSYSDCNIAVLDNLDLLTREVFLPLLCSDEASISKFSVSGDRLMDQLHRVIATAETTSGYTKGHTVLPLPSVEVLAEAAQVPSRRPAVLHVLESTVIGWMKQIRSMLKHDPISDLKRVYGKYSTPLDELKLWEARQLMLHSIEEQLDAPVAKDIIVNLEEAQSQYANPFQQIRQEIASALDETKEILQFWKTLKPWFEKFHESETSSSQLKHIPPIVHTVMLVWQYSRHYHKPENFTNLLRVISNEVVQRAKTLIGEDLLEKPVETYSKLKDALKVCAAFRGTYLDYRDKAEVINQQNMKDHCDQLSHRNQANQLFTTKVYGPYAYQPNYGFAGNEKDDGSEKLASDDDLYVDSPWPQRNADCFSLLNSFMERCNDVLELVQTTSHFNLLAETAGIGGAGSQSLDAHVKEINERYQVATKHFFHVVSNVLDIDGTQAFETAFFKFRSVVKKLELQLAEIISQSFGQCPTVGAQLRLLEVFEGISNREQVQSNLQNNDRILLQSFSDELLHVKTMFSYLSKSPPLHKNTPALISKLQWVNGLRQRIQKPMEQLKNIASQLLEGEIGWEVRDTYNECLTEFARYEQHIIDKWQKRILPELTNKLKQPVFVADDFDEEIEIRPQVIHVNLDPNLILILREIHYLSQNTFDVNIPASAKELTKHCHSFTLNVLATRLDTIANKYNSITKNISDYERPLFERKLAKIDQLLEKGLTTLTWHNKELEDFIETASQLICTDMYVNLDIVQSNCKQIAENSHSWCKIHMDIFTARASDTSYNMSTLKEMQAKIDETIENDVVPAGLYLHQLVDQSFKAIGISKASPAWEDYMDFLDAIVLNGLKQTTVTSLSAMFREIAEPDGTSVPILTVRLELIQDEVTFRPPLDGTTSSESVKEVVNKWIYGFLRRAEFVEMFGSKGSYKDYIEADEEVRGLCDEIYTMVNENTQECKTLVSLFSDYTFLWEQDSTVAFAEFLKGNISPNPRRSVVTADGPARMRHEAAARSLVSSSANSSQTHETLAQIFLADAHFFAAMRRANMDLSLISPKILCFPSLKHNHYQRNQFTYHKEAIRSSSLHSLESSGVLGTAEKSFLAREATDDEKNTIPTLDAFDAEIDIYKTARDEITDLQQFCDMGWIRVDLQPIKQVLTTHASKWIWMFTSYLTEQVSRMLLNLDAFLKRIEPEIESIRGNERDTASFMKMMRLFNEVTAEQQEIDVKFAAMHRTVLLLKKYNQFLPADTQALFQAAPVRWNNLKTKVSLAKQRLGPRIQEESERITKDLALFGQRLKKLETELDESVVFSYECSMSESWTLLDKFSSQFAKLENEAQDLAELQELLEIDVVNFEILPKCRLTIENLKQVWEAVRILSDEQNDWKCHRWHKINTKQLKAATDRQLEALKQLPEESSIWDVYHGLQDSILTIQACLPLIDDLSNPAMRTRHWKQLVRVTGGAVQIDNDTLKRMTLGELLNLGLQTRVDDVRAIVQRAVKDLAIEKSLKTYEEVWLSKLFELRAHCRSKASQEANDVYINRNNEQATAKDAQSEVSHAESHLTSHTNRPPATRSGSRVSAQSSVNKLRRGSASSLPASLLNVTEDTGVLMLLTNTDIIFDELESHQVSLQTMHGSSAAGSFMDEVLKWQKRLQTIEAVVTVWLDVQDKWIELEEVFTSAEIKSSLIKDCQLFDEVNRDFKLLMRATEKNPNILQCCSRKNILPLLERMKAALTHCHKSLLSQLSRRLQKFPRFYFLSLDDVLKVVCNGYDPKQINRYINKLFENIGTLTYTEADDTTKYLYVITGVQSLLGEVLTLKQPIPCEGQIESWLPTLLQQITTVLKFQLSTIMSNEEMDTKPAATKKAIKTGGSRKIILQSSHGSRPTSKQKPDRPLKQGEGTMSPQVSQAGNQAKIDDEEPTTSSWTLDNLCETVYLATQLQFTSKISQTCQKLSDGDSKALDAAVKELEKSIHETVLLLKGLETKQERLEMSRAASERAASAIPASVHEAAGAKSPTAKDGSTLDLTGDDQRPETAETAHSHAAGTANQDSNAEATQEKAQTNTIDLGDTFNQIMTKNDREQEMEIEYIQQADIRLMLFPSQIHKIASLISLMSYYRDLLKRLAELHKNGDTDPMNSYMFKSQLKYSFDIDGKVVVRCLNMDMDYDFEYVGAANREIISPLTERVFVSMVSAIHDHFGSLITGPVDGGKLETARELSRSLGRPFYWFNCHRSYDYILLQNVFKGLALTGAMVCFNNLHYLTAPLLSEFAKLMTLVIGALRKEKTTTHFLGEEIHINNKAACIALTSNLLYVKSSNPDSERVFPAVTAQLPDDIVKQFRQCCMLRPDIKLTVETLLLTQGFTNASSLAHKLVLVQDLCSNLVGLETVFSSKPVIGVDLLEYKPTWSVRSLKNIILQAGVLLDKKTSDLLAAKYETFDQNGENELNNAQNDAEESLEQQLYNDEEWSLVSAVRDTLIPRLNDRDKAIFISVVRDIFPRCDVPLEFVSSTNAQGSLELNTTVLTIPNTDMKHDNMSRQHEALEDVEDSIAVATGNLGLLPGVAFQARVLQLAHLSNAHRAIMVCGPSGCGKSECIKTFAVAERERGKYLSIQSVFTKAFNPDLFLGHFNEQREWCDGLLPYILRKYCARSINPDTASEQLAAVKVVLLDGECDPVQMEMINSILNNDGQIVMANHERITMSGQVKFIWESDSLSNMTPAILSQIGILVMDSSDVGWKMMIRHWLKHRAEDAHHSLETLADIYIPKVVEFLSAATSNDVSKKRTKDIPSLKRSIHHTEENMLSTFYALFEGVTSTLNFSELSDEAFERYFVFAVIWSFAGTLTEECREKFSDWWRGTFKKRIAWPFSGTVFDYTIDPESKEFTSWSNVIAPYSAAPHSGIPSDAFVHTASHGQLYHLLSVISESNRPVLIVGESGCGKSSIVKERIRNISTGEVAEVLALTQIANRFTTSQLLYERINEMLEWKHGRTYIPKGGKKLVCLIDDLNLSHVDEHGYQTAVELIRQHLDEGGFYSTDNFQWRYVRNVTYMSTLNPKPNIRVPQLSQRLLRHFAVLYCPMPNGKELERIYRTLLHTHFVTPEVQAAASISASAAQHLGIKEEKVKASMNTEEEQLKNLLTLITVVTIQLQSKLKRMFLNTAERCHYSFTMKDLSVIFRNLTLSLQAGCDSSDLLYLWRHECDFVYGSRMVTYVDRNRYDVAFRTAVRKEFVNDAQSTLLCNEKKPIFSNLVELDSGAIISGSSQGSSDNKSYENDNYKACWAAPELRTLLVKATEEYNKVYPKINLALYSSTIQLICRIARVLSSPHQVAHLHLVAEGSPGLTSIMVRLAAHLSDFLVVQLSNSFTPNNKTNYINLFKAELVNAYTRAGVRHERILFLLHEEELFNEDFLVFITEFITCGNISYLFSHEEKTTIVNSIRTDVTQAGLTFTQDVAWSFFLNKVEDNFRVCLISSDTSVKFQRRCREFPSLISYLNYIWIPHWSKSMLLEHAQYHINEVEWMSSVQKENVAHMLAAFHQVIRQADGKEETCGSHNHLTNTTYEKFVTRFISLANRLHTDITKQHETVTQALTQIYKENELAEKLYHQLEHEKIVLDERIAGTAKILSQIGQDTAITEQQVKIVKQQMEKIKKLKKLLPDYQIAHERAVFKASALAIDTKKLISEMTMESLQELRATQKPVIEVEDLMAAIIMILKSPTADLTWQKGAKRQMANLERFLEELATFDDQQMPESTLILVEPYLKKQSFVPEVLSRKSNNSACAALCKWVHGVVKYHRMMLSRVKPLHDKVIATSSSVNDAEHKMSTLDSKRKALELRLKDLAKGFEDATIDKNDQETKTIKMEEMLSTATHLRQALQKETSRAEQIHASLNIRLSCIDGAASMASAFTTYLGPYQHGFRRMMLTVQWPHCLRERGIPLVIDTVDHIRGRVIEFAIEGLTDNTDVYKQGVSSPEMFETDYRDGMESVNTTESLTNEKRDEAEGEDNEEGEEPAMDGTTADATATEDGDTTLNLSAPPTRQKDGQQLEPLHEAHEDDGLVANTEEDNSEDQVLPISPQLNQIVSISSTVTKSQYKSFISSLVRLLVGEQLQLKWTKKDADIYEMENAAILASSWQSPAYLIDPNSEGRQFLENPCNSVLMKKPIVIEENVSDQASIIQLEKAITNGLPAVVTGIAESLNHVLMPIIYHYHTLKEDHYEHGEPMMINYCGRRLLCHQQTQLYLSSPLEKPRISSLVASLTTPVSFNTDQDSLTDKLLKLAFIRLRPDLYKEKMQTLKTIHTLKELLNQIIDYTRRDMKEIAGGKIWNEQDVQIISDGMKIKQEVSEKLQTCLEYLEKLKKLQDELLPIAQRAALLFTILSSLSSLHPFYHLRLPQLVSMFEEAVGEAPPDDIFLNEDDQNDKDLSEEEPLNTGASESVVQGGISHDAKDSEQDKQTTAGVSQVENNSDEDFNSNDNQSDTSKASTEAKPGQHDLTPYIQVLQSLPNYPTEDADLSEVGAENIEGLVSQLTDHVVNYARLSVDGDHQLLLNALITLHIEKNSIHSEDRAFSDEELSLLTHGNPGLGLQLSLEDFGSEAKPPTWLPKDKWENIMALSVLPGALDNLCVKIAESPDQWYEWYTSKNPEKSFQLVESDNSGETETETATDKDGTLDNDNTAMENQDSDKQNEENTSVELSDFQKLLIIRMLRVDRFHYAITDFLAKTTNQEDEPKPILFEDLHKFISSGHLSLLVRLPTYRDKVLSSKKIELDIVGTLSRACQMKNIEFSSVVMSANSAHEVDSILDAAFKSESDSWILLDKLHLAPQQALATLANKLHRYALSRKAHFKDEGANVSQVLVWMTSEDDVALPSSLILHSYTLSWHVIKDEFFTVGHINQPSVSLASLTDCLTQGIVKALEIVPSQYWSKTTEMTGSARVLLFSVAVLHGILSSRQIIGSAGLSQWYPLCSVEMIESAEMVTSDLFSELDEDAQLLNKIGYIRDNIYTAQMCSQQDRDVVSFLADTIMKGIVFNTVGILTFSDYEIPLPPPDIDPATYHEWFEEVQSERDISTISSTGLHKGVQQHHDMARAKRMVTELDMVVESLESESTTSQSSQDILSIDTAMLNLLCVTCLEKLPNLLNLGSDMQAAYLSHYNFPYHPPSAYSQASTAKGLMPESIGHALLQECIYMNSLLCHVRQNIYDIMDVLIAGSEGLTTEQYKVARDMLDQNVPLTWNHPLHQPNTHTLFSWLEDLGKRYNQMKLWIKRGIVPRDKQVHTKSSTTKDSHPFHGKLTNIWLGGLFNPAALLTAIKHEKAVIEETTHDQIVLTCEQLSIEEVNEGDILVEGLYLQSAAWDSETSQLVPSETYMNKMPSVYIKAHSREKWEAKQAEEEQINFYSSPVFMTMTRQALVGHLPMKGGEDLSRWQTSSTCIILDPGVPEDYPRKVTLVQPARVQDLQVAPSEPDTFYQTRLNTAATGLSHYSQSKARIDQQTSKLPTPMSQLSYKPITPKADKLPPTLALQRDGGRGLNSSKPNTPLANKGSKPLTPQAIAKSPKPASPLSKISKSPQQTLQSSTKSPKPESPLSVTRSPKPDTKSPIHSLSKSPAESVTKSPAESVTKSPTQGQKSPLQSASKSPTQSVTKSPKPNSSQSMNKSRASLQPSRADSQTSRHSQL